MVKIFTFSSMKANSYIWYNHLGDALFIDSACNSYDELDEIEHFVTEKNLKPIAILLTHAHFDHTMGVNFLKERYSVDSWLNQEDLGELSASLYMAVIQQIKPNRPLREIDQLFVGEPILTFGDIKVKTLHVPGHTKGSICYYFEEEGAIFVGDVIKGDTIGLPITDSDLMLKSLSEKIFTLDPDSTIYSGHGAPTTIANIKLPSSVRHLKIK